LKKKLEYEFALFDSDNGAYIEKETLSGLVASMVDLASTNRKSSITVEDNREDLITQKSKNEDNLRISKRFLFNSILIFIKKFYL
jgi:hypothetical protein